MVTQIFKLSNTMQDRCCSFLKDSLQLEYTQIITAICRCKVYSFKRAIFPQNKKKGFRTEPRNAYMKVKNAQYYNVRVWAYVG